MRQTVALFGEAEKGEFSTLLPIQSLETCQQTLGNPPDESRGIYFAIQALMYECDVLFCRVQEEGFSTLDYFKGLDQLHNNPNISSLAAIGLPGVGDAEIIEATTPICYEHKSILISTERDLYDYLTTFN